MTKSELEDLFLFQALAAGLPTPEREYRFAREVVGNEPGLRKRLAAAGLKDWQMDFAWPARKIACECEGGTWSHGRHVRGSGFEEDCRKYNEAALLGWTVLRFTARMVEDSTALDAVERALSNG